MNKKHQTVLARYFRTAASFSSKTCLSTILDHNQQPEVVVAPRDGCQGDCEEHAVMTMLAAGEIWLISAVDYLELPRGPNLSHLCREAIRNHLLDIDRHENLFVRVPRLGLPPVLNDYLLYNVSLNRSD